MEKHETSYHIAPSVLQIKYSENHIGKYIKEMQEDHTLLYFEEYVDWLVDIILNKFNIKHTKDLSSYIYMLDIVYYDVFHKESKDKVTNLYYEDFVLWLEERISIL